MSLTSFVPTPELEFYRQTFSEHFKIERREDGVVTMRLHTRDGPYQLSVESHRAIGQALKVVASDPKNELMIFTGTGESFLAGIDPDGFALEEADLEYWAYEYAYKDGRVNVSSLVNDFEIPTIGVLNGPGAHTEMVLMCDITICSEDAIIWDPHYAIGSVPGDGIHSCFIEILGVKRAAYALLTSEVIDAKRALEYGMVNEVVSRDSLMDRAYEIADSIMKQKRVIRRLSSQIVRRPWKQRVADDLDGGFGTQMFGHVAKKEFVHSRTRVDDVADSFGVDVNE
ncbi:enoyl-CoA hydratase/isomerase family protein [Haliea sp. E17]|uniref:enoyl-CoA hydratase/isomerase family protein n=1 Tax=Haliea sp. E17 TaxID=3401576 RepID=UPI003AB04220